jgi:hypothetical protein
MNTQDRSVERDEQPIDFSVHKDMDMNLRKQMDFNRNRLLYEHPMEKELYKKYPELKQEPCLLKSMRYFLNSFLMFLNFFRMIFGKMFVQIVNSIKMFLTFGTLNVIHNNRTQISQMQHVSVCGKMAGRTAETCCFTF